MERGAHCCLQTQAMTASVRSCERQRHQRSQQTHDSHINEASIESARQSLRNKCHQTTNGLDMSLASRVCGVSSQIGAQSDPHHHHNHGPHCRQDDYDYQTHKYQSVDCRTKTQPIVVSSPSRLQDSSVPQGGHSQCDQCVLLLDRLQSRGPYHTRRPFMSHRSGSSENDHSTHVIRTLYASLMSCGMLHRIMTAYLLLAVLCTQVFRPVRALPVADMQQYNTIGCIWRSSISPTMPLEQEFSPRPECRFGQLWWYNAYPGYTLRVFFRHSVFGADFRLCLQHHDKAYVRYVHRVQRRGAGATIERPPSKDVDTCLTSENGVIELYFEAPSDTVYVTVIQYVIRDLT